jgi:F-box/WD-40 domain protein 7
VQVWDLNTLSRVKTLTGHTDAVRALACADGRLFSGSYDGTVRVWDENSLQCLEILKGHTGPVRTLVYAGGCMFSGSYDKTVRVWDVHTLECKAVLSGHTGAVRALVASQTHGYVFSGSDDTTIKVRTLFAFTPHVNIYGCHVYATLSSSTLLGTCSSSSGLKRA